MATSSSNSTSDKPLPAQCTPSRQRTESDSIEMDKPVISLTTKIFVSFTMGLVKSVTYMYELISWPIYSLFSSGDAIVDSKGEMLSMPTGHLINNEPDYSSPWRCVEAMDCDLDYPMIPGCNTLPDLLDRAVRLWPDKTILGTRKLIKVEMEPQPNGRKFKKITQGEYEWLSFSQINERITSISKGLLYYFHLKPCSEENRILIFAETRAEWQLCAQACFRFGIPMVTLYSTLGDEALVHAVNETEISVMFTSDELLGKVIKLLLRMPLVKKIVYMRRSEGQTVEGDDFVVPTLGDEFAGVELLSLVQFERLGVSHCHSAAQSSTSLLQVRPTAQHLAVIMYTSGSTGQPKGVEMTQANLMSAMAGMSDRMPKFFSRDSYIAYLPLAHVLELSCENVLLSQGVAIGYGSALTLVDAASKVKRGTKGDMRELRPTLMACVPTILDRLHKTVWEQVNAAGPLFVAMFTWALSFRRRRLERGFPSLLMDRVVFRRIRRVLGGRVRLMISGGAPLSEPAQEFINSCFCRIVQGYGLTETCAAGTIGSINNLCCGHVGAPLRSVELQLKPWLEGGYSPQDKPRPRGEILIGGPAVSRGYFKQPDKTKEDFFVDAKGQRWFCTGDIGVFHSDGTLSIIDRKKDLVKLQMGEYISLGKVEMAMSSCPLVEQVCIYGDGYASSVVALVVPKRKALLDVARKVFEASNDSAGAAKLAAAESSLASGDFSDQDFEFVCQHSRVRRTVLKMLQEVGQQKALNSSEIPSAVYLDTRMWSPDNGLLTDAMKLKRRFIQETFQKQIDEMYNRPAASNTASTSSGV